MLRYCTNLGFVGYSEHRYSISMGDYGSSVVDKSKFRPTLVNNGSGQRVVGTSRSPVYDFEDGKDTGLRFGVIRNLGADITEVDAVQNILQKTVNNQIKVSEKKLNDTLEAIQQQTQLQQQQTQLQGGSSND